MAGPGIVPFVQTLPGPGDVTWTVEVLQNPDSERELAFDFGDGTSSTATIPRRTGSASLALVRFLPLGRYVQRATIADVEEPSAGHAPMAQAVTGVGVGVDLEE